MFNFVVTFDEGVMSWLSHSQITCEAEVQMTQRRNTPKLLQIVTRELEPNVSLYFNVHVIRDDRKRFGPIIIQEIRDSYGEVMEQIQ